MAAYASRAPTRTLMRACAHIGSTSLVRNHHDSQAHHCKMLLSASRGSLNHGRTEAGADAGCAHHSRRGRMRSAQLVLPGVGPRAARRTLCTDGHGTHMRLVTWMHGE
jgi:hypothetical protein